MDIITLPSNEQRCHELYGHLELNTTSNKTILCTLAIIILTFWLEVLSNGKLDCCDFEKQKRDEQDAARLATHVESLARPLITTMTAKTIVVDQPQLQQEPQAGPQAPSENDGPTVTGTQSSDGTKPNNQCGSFCCYENPSPRVRANRLRVASLLFSLILTAFIIRIKEANKHPYVEDLCVQIIKVPRPNWTSIIYFNIFPFVLACFAFLRALVDCVLVRWGTGLTYQTNNDNEKCCWMPLLPFLAAVIVVYLLLDCLNIPLAWWMGDPELSMWTSKKTQQGKKKAEDIERQDEETQGLLSNVDGPPTCHGVPMVCSPRVSLEGKHKDNGAS